MPKEQIVFLDNLKIGNKNVEKLSRYGKIIRHANDWPDEEKAIKLAQDSTIIINKWIFISQKILSASKNLRYVVMAMTGYHDWIDIDAARKLKIKVSNVPAFSSQAVAEHAILLMLSVIRKLLPANSDLKNGNFNSKSFKGIELSGKTLGIIGYGNIGQHIAQLARGFGMNILTADSKSSKKEIETLLSKSYFLSVNTPLTPQTEKLIGENELSLLPQGAVVINTSRGKVIDEEALIDHLKNGHLGGAGLDVFAKEPPAKNNPLFSLPNVVTTPHIAWNTKESLERLGDGVVANIEAFLKGKPINIVS